MSTIDFLMEGKKPGEIKVCYFGDAETRVGHWPSHMFFVPYFKDQVWYGLDEKHNVQQYKTDQDWSLYQEPKKKVTKWLCADHAGKIIDGMLSDDEIKDHPNAYGWKRLLSAEFDE